MRKREILKIEREECSRLDRVKERKGFGGRRRMDGWMDICWEKMEMFGIKLKCRSDILWGLLWSVVGGKRRLAAFLVVDVGVSNSLGIIV